MDQIMAGDAGLEPTHARVKVWCLTNLANPQNSWSIGVPEGSRTPDTRLRRAVLYPAELQAHNLKKMERVKGIEPSRSAWKAGALPLSYTRILVEGAGFEPAKALPTDLQSAPFSHSGTPPYFFCNYYLCFYKIDYGAGDRN